MPVSAGLCAICVDHQLPLLPEFVGPDVCDASDASVKKMGRYAQCMGLKCALVGLVGSDARGASL